MNIAIGCCLLGFLFGSIVTFLFCVMKLLPKITVTVLKDLEQEGYLTVNEKRRR